MRADEVQTEQLIKEKARNLFFQKGILNATTQEIADEAGVNRALIHYYFRSREQMVETLVDETISEKKHRIRTILSLDLPFRQRIALFIHVVVDYSLAYPHLENFIISEMARHPDKLKAICSRDKVKSTDLIREDLEIEIRHKRIAPITPEHFMVNLSAMCHYPLLAKSILQVVHGMTDAGYRKFLLERKKAIYATIFNEEMPDVSVSEALRAELNL